MSLYDACREYVSARDSRNWATEELEDQLFHDFMEAASEREDKARAQLAYYLHGQVPTS